MSLMFVCNFCYITMYLNVFVTQNYPGKELLLVYDYEFKYGQNFYLCLTEEAKERILHVRYALYMYDVCKFIRIPCFVFQ